MIKVEKQIAPRVAKLDDATRASIRRVLTEKLVQETMKALRARTAQEALQPSILEIRDPEMKKQFEARVAEHAAQQKEADDARQQKALRPFVLPATRPKGPATVPSPAPAPATNPTKPEASDRPPATRSGAATGAPDSK